MTKKLIIILLLATSALFPYKAVLFNGTGASAQDKLLALTLAGIVNRDSSRLFLMNVFETWSYSSTDENWTEVYRTRGGVQFDTITTISALIDRFRQFIQGGVSYDPNQYFSNFTGQNFRWQGEFAAMIGGLTDRLPVTVAMASQNNLLISDSLLIHDYFDGDPDIYVTGKLENSSHSWNGTGMTNEQKYLTIVDWGIVNLLPRCDPKRFFIREITDFAVQKRMFQFDLAGTADLHFEYLPDARAELIERVLVFMHAKNPTDLFQIYGWMMPEPLIQWFACYGSSFNESMQANFSWHASFPVTNSTFTRASMLDTNSVRLDNKYYLIFIGSEGDASNWVMGFQSGAWRSTDRGNVPVAWGWNLNLFNECPFIAQYYSETATVNDGFISVTSPLGYAYPDLWPAEVWQSGVDSSIALMNRYHVSDIYAYKHYANGQFSTIYRGKLINNSYNFTKLGQFLKQSKANMAFSFDPSIGNQTATTNYNSVIFNHSDETFYGDVSNLNTAAARILNVLKSKGKPYFYLAGYERLRMDNFAGRTDPSSADINLPRLKQLVALIKADTTIGRDIEIVTPERFSILLRKKLGVLSVKDDNSLPLEFSLLQNYPNPFNPTTEIQYQLKAAGKVKLAVYNVLGKEIAVLVNEEQEPGNHTVHFASSNYNLASGIYFYRLQAGEKVAVKKMVLAK